MANVNLTLKNPNLLQTGLLINNKFINDRHTYPILNPANNQLIIAVAKANESDIDYAIQCASKAFQIWKKICITERVSVLKKWYNLIIENLEDLAIILTLESGKPLNEARAEILYGASYLEWYSEEIKRTDGDVIPPYLSTQKITVTKEPIGVCGIITPWNFPNAMIMRKVAPAIACGCSVVIKPASQTPLSALAIGYLGIKAGLIDGLLNIVIGESELIGNKLTHAEAIRKISFTGSTTVGKELYKKSANSLKKLSLELGGNAPFIIFDDANIDNAVDGLIKAKFRNSGQACICANRIFIAKTLKETFIQKLEARVNKLSVGNGLDVGIDVGPLINQNAVKHTKKLIEDALIHGAEIITGGNVHIIGGNFFAPTIIDNCTPEMMIFKEEIFAPIIAIYQFETDKEVIELANKTEYGLAAYFYSNNINRIYQIAEQLQFGMIGINTGSISGTNIPFGGIKHSGFGREGGKYGIYEYLNLKYNCLEIVP